MLLHSDRGALNTKSAVGFIQVQFLHYGPYVFTDTTAVLLLEKPHPTGIHACMSVATCSFIVDVHMLVVPSMKASRKLVIEPSFSLNWEQMAHLRMATWLRLAMLNFSHKKLEVFNVWSFSATHFSAITLHVRFLAGGPSVDDDLDDDNLVLTCPDIATTQY